MGKENVKRGQRFSIAKITRPFITGVFPRKRLFRQLDSSRGKPVIWVSGPPGCGKTTLIASYLDYTKIPCIWYQVDEGDDDLPTFFYYLGLAARKAAPKIKKPLPLLTPEYLKGITTFTLRYFENLFSRLKTPFIVVLDSYQKVPAESLVHEIISAGLSVVPEKVHIIIISRGDPPPKLVSLCASNKINFIGWDDIRFTLDESREIVRSGKHTFMPGEILIRLHRKTEGWIAGLIIIMEMAKMKNIDYQALERFTPEEIFHYFLSEIYEKTDSEIQDFLMKTSFLQSMTATMAGNLTDNKRAEKILSVLSQNHYFTEKDSQVEPFYQYHPLFREFLLSRARNSLSPREINSVRKRAADILEKSEQIENSADLLLDAGEWEGVGRLIRKHARALISQGRYKTLEVWLNRIPKEILDEKPWLLYWLGVCNQPLHTGRSRSFFEDAFQKFMKQKDVNGIFISWSGIVESVFLGYEGLKPLDRWFSVLDGLLKEFKDLPSEQVEARVICSMIRGISLRRPHHVDNEAWAERAFTIAQKTEDIPLKIEILVNIACYRYSGVELQKMEMILELLQGMLRRHDLPPLTHLIVKWVEAAYFNITSQYDRCLKVVTDGLGLANTTGIHIMDYMLMGQGTLCSLKTGDAATAGKYLSEMAYSLNSAKPWEASFYYYTAAWEALFSGNIEQASFHSEQCLRLCEEVGNPWTLSLAYLQRAVILFESQPDKQAFGHLHKACSIGIQNRNEYTQFACFLLEAYFFLRGGKESRAIELLKKGLQLGRKNNFINLYMWKRGVMETIAEKALEEGIEAAYVQDLIRWNGLIPEKISGIEEWPYFMKVYTLGKFRLFINGNQLNFSGKVQKKPLLLLKSLIALGSTDVREEQVTDMLWPEADGDAAHTVFTTTLCRLRRLIGNDSFIRFQEGRATLDSRYCWVDSWAFENIASQAEAVWKDIQQSGSVNGIEEAIHLADKAIGMYRGHFLDDEIDYPWSVTMRERLKSKFIKLVSRSGHYYEQKGFYEKATECYLRGLEIDDLIEEFYQRLIICYHHLGFQGEAMSMYQRCRKTLSAVLGIEPSPATENIYKTYVMKMNEYEKTGKRGVTNL